MDTFAEFRCIRRVSQKRFHDSTSRFPPLAPAGGSSPASSVLSRRYDFLPPVPPRFVTFAWRYLGCTRLVRSSTDEWPSRPGVGNPVSPAGILPRKRQDLASSWGISIVRSRMFSRRRQDCSHQTIAMQQRGPRYVKSEGSRERAFGAQ